MKNPNIKVWMWQRLWKIASNDEVYSSYGIYEDSWWLHMNPQEVETEYKWNWLCSKPNLVLINVNRNNSNAEGKVHMS